jgi:hypothetical protein
MRNNICQAVTREGLSQKVPPLLSCNPFSRTLPFLVASDPPNIIIVIRPEKPDLGMIEHTLLLENLAQKQ